MRIAPAFMMVGVAVLLTSCPLTATLKPVKVGSGQVTLQTSGAWTSTQWPGTSAIELVHTRQTPTGPVRDGRIMVLTEKRVSHDEAVDRLIQIAVEAPGSTFLLIDGWPALQRKQTVTVVPPTVAEGQGGPPQKVVLVTTAVAAGDVVVRAEGSIHELSASVVTEVEQIGRSLVFDARPDPAQAQIDLQRVRAAAAQPITSPVPLTPRGAIGASTTGPGVPTRAGGTVGELQVAANGDQVVVAGQFASTFFSNNGGLTFAPAIVNTATTGNEGDPSITRGASGAYYLSILTTPMGSCAASVFASAPGNPAMFNFAGHGAFCPGTGNPQCFPDQEHIAADPNPSGTGSDQIYMVWRHFIPIFGGNCPRQNTHTPGPAISCSSNGGATWTPAAPIAAGDWARVTVGGDGFVWVVHRSHQWIVISKYSSCQNGLVMQAGFPKNVVPVFDPSCPISGLDRCTGAVMSSATVAVDQTNPNHVYVAFATATSPGNDEIHVVDTTDAFATWPRNGRETVISGPALGRRYMPWSCTSGSAVHVGWYDRRGATSTANDLTAYFRGSASVQGTSLVAGAEVNVSGVNDPQCASGFRCGERDLNDNETCPVPQNDGMCFATLGPPPTGSGTPCRQSRPSCPAGERCVPNNSNSGCPKYGDYNGIACTNGHVYATWASATPPPGVFAPGGINLFVDARPCGGPGQACCASGTACGTGLSCAAGTCATTACGGVGQPCCGGASPCAAGSGCSAGMCTTCPRTLADVTVHAGSNCFGNTQTRLIGQPVCDPGMVPTCTATLVSLANGSTCSATVLPGSCLCNITAQTPHDCTKWADCRGILTMAPAGSVPVGCP